MAKSTVEFVNAGDELHLIYHPRDDTTWVYRKFRDGESLVIKGTFHLTRANLVIDDVDHVATILDPDSNPESWGFNETELRFVVARATGTYFQFDSEILPVGVPVLLDRHIQPTWKWFSAEEKTSVLGVAAQLRPSRIVIGGSADDAIPVGDYQRLVDQFPTSHELKRYVLARISTVIRQYSDATVDAEAMLRKYVARRVSAEGTDLISAVRETEAVKFEFLLERLKEMLRSEQGYPERLWQSHILDIVRLLNSKYIAAFKSVPIKDFEKDKRRQLDILLVDATGHVDVIEIKKPSDNSVMSGNVYRDNHIPLRELTGSVMQTEKYIFHLSRWGQAGEKYLTRRYASELPPGLQIKITNPSGIVIMGRDHDLSVAQRRDFEVFRRQNKNIVDVITYDDLLRRLEVVLAQLKAGR